MARFVVREYEARCEMGHRTYVRLDTLEPQRIGRCNLCGADAVLAQLVPKGRTRREATT
jgi:hypothetical protein